MKRRVTQQDIANALGLDKSTVSLALSKSPNIKTNTRERVAAMAEEMGYRPDPALATLARQRWSGHETGSGATLAYLVDSRMTDFHLQPRFFSAARARAEERGYRLHEFNLADYPTVDSASRVLHHRGVRGVLVPQFSHTEGPGILQMPVKNLTVICLDVGWIPVPFHIVAPDTFQAARIVWAETVKRGYKRIGAAVLSHTPRAVDDAARFGACAASIEEYLPKARRIPMLTSDIADRSAFLSWFRKYKPEVVISFIRRVYDWILEAGYRVPEDVAVVGLTVFPDQTPELSGVLRQTDDVGAMGLDALISSMNEHEWGVPQKQRKLLLEPEWYEGTTLPDRR